MSPDRLGRLHKATEGVNPHWTCTCGQKNQSNRWYCVNCGLGQIA